MMSHILCYLTQISWVCHLHRDKIAVGCTMGRRQANEGSVMAEGNVLLGNIGSCHS